MKGVTCDKQSAWRPLRETIDTACVNMRNQILLIWTRDGDLVHDGIFETMQISPAQADLQHGGRNQWFQTTIDKHIICGLVKINFGVKLEVLLFCIK